MFFYSVQHRLLKMENLAKSRLESAIDTFLLRTLFVLMVISSYLPKRAKVCEHQAVYYAVIGIAFALTAALYPVGTAIDGMQKTKEFLHWVKGMEYKAEFYLRTHYIFLIIALLIYAASLLKGIA